MAFSDYVIILVCVAFGALFILFSTDKVYKFYLWLIFWFLVFLVVNLYIKVLILSWISNSISDVSFFAKNKDFVLALSASMIPIFWLFSVFNENEASNKPILSFSFGLFIPIFLISAFSFILVNSSIRLEFLSWIMSIFKGSTIYLFFKHNTKYIFYFIVFILFWRFIITLLVRLLSTFYETLIEYVSKIKNIKKSDK